ncbi:hypothetical protein SAMN02745687_02420 [Lachnospiraceae bacterium NK3A20]|nr:hypothetical protein SAMN02745687_02420 [Lachnospiraceae bacterium NK3A20]
MPFYGSVMNIYHQYIQAGPLRAEHKRVSLLHSRKVSGSMTVEAALVLPLYIFFMCNILYLFSVMRFQNSMACALRETGSQMSEAAWFVRYGASDLTEIFPGEEAGAGAGEADTGGRDGIGGALAGATANAMAEATANAMLSETYIRSSCEEYLGRDYMNRCCLDGGAASVSYLRSNILSDDDTISLVADYPVRPFVPVLGPAVFTLENRYYAHAWVGYDVTHGEDAGDPEETMVYITPTGTVYHRTRSCTYLKPSVQTIPATALGRARNDAGAKYYPCECCHPSRSGMVIITSDGNRYHSSASCPGIKRTVIEVPLSEVKDRMRACSKCGGG